MNFSAIIFVVTLFVMTVSAYTGKEKDRFLGKMAELADEVEVEFDSRRTNYCKAYGNQFAQNCSAWSTVRAECLENMLLDLEERDTSDDIMDFKYENNAMLFDMYQKCAPLATNPCDDQNWSDIKKCAREVFTSVPAFKPNRVVIPIGNGIVLSDEALMGMNVDHVFTERIVLTGVLDKAEMDKCTSKTLMVASS